MQAPRFVTTHISPSTSRDSRVGSGSSVLPAYLAVIAVNLIIVLLASLAGSGESIAMPYAMLSVGAGVVIFRHVVRVSGHLLTPLTLYVAVWMILIPSTAFAVPLMDEMSSEQIAVCAIFGIAFSAGGVLFGLHRYQPTSSKTFFGDVDHQKRLARAASVLLVISIGAIALNLLLEGRIALFAAEGEDRKAAAHFVGYPILSSLGSISIAVYAASRRASGRQVILSIVYIVLQLLTAQRFVAVVTLILAVVAFASVHELSRKNIRKVLLLVLAVLGVFVLVSLYRGGASDQQMYFINTGLYGGDPVILQATEILRYIGQSQRNLTTVMERGFDVTSAGNFTLSPLTALFQEVPTGLGTSIHGYTANNVIAYLYSDFGTLWPFAVLGLALIAHASYYRMLSQGSFASIFLWCVVSLGLATSFFAYVNAFTYWVLLFPLFAALLESATRPSQPVAVAALSANYY